VKWDYMTIYAATPPPFGRHGDSLAVCGRGPKAQFITSRRPSRTVKHGPTHGDRGSRRKGYRMQPPRRRPICRGARGDRSGPRDRTVIRYKRTEKGGDTRQDSGTNYTPRPTNHGGARARQNRAAPSTRTATGHYGERAPGTNRPMFNNGSGRHPRPTGEIKTGSRTTRGRVNSGTAVAYCTPEEKSSRGKASRRHCRRQLRRQVVALQTGTDGPSSSTLPK